jgi:Na+-translocating ferredoxin:NAD+ oxidoreductase RnfC subunit
VHSPIDFFVFVLQEKLELWEIRQYNERKERERALQREKKMQEEATRRAAELRAAAIQRKQQEQQAKQQQQILKKKVQNAIKTQQRKLTNVNQTVNRPVINTMYKPLVTVTTLPNTSFTQTSKVLQTSLSRQPLPRITDLVTQYRPSSLSHPRVPVGSPVSVVRQVTRPQINYRPLATTVQSKSTAAGGENIHNQKCYLCAL